MDDLVFSRIDDGDAFNSQLAVDTNGDGFGDGAVAVAAGTAVSLSDAGGTAVNSVSVQLTITAEANSEEFWTNGTLQAYFTPVPEPSTFALLGLVGLAGFARRRK